MTAAVSAFMPFAFGTLRLHRVEAACIPGNGASIRLLEKTGFRREGFARQYLCINGVWQDHLLFARLRDDPRALTKPGAALGPPGCLAITRADEGTCATIPSTAMRDRGFRPADCVGHACARGASGRRRDCCRVLPASACPRSAAACRTGSPAPAATSADRTALARPRRCRQLDEIARRSTSAPARARSRSRPRPSSRPPTICAISSPSRARPPVLRRRRHGAHAGRRAGTRRRRSRRRTAAGRACRSAMRSCAKACSQRPSSPNSGGSRCLPPGATNVVVHRHRGGSELPDAAAGGAGGLCRLCRLRRSRATAASGRSRKKKARADAQQLIAPARETTYSPAAQRDHRRLELAHVGNDGARAGGQQAAGRAPEPEWLPPTKPIAVMPALTAAVMPAGESSTTMQSAGATSSSWRHAGAGRAPACRSARRSPKTGWARRSAPGSVVSRLIRMRSIGEEEATHFGPRSQVSA